MVKYADLFKIDTTVTGILGLSNKIYVNNSMCCLVFLTVTYLHYFYYAIIRLFLIYFDILYNPNCHKLWTNLGFNILFKFTWIVFS